MASATHHAWSGRILRELRVRGGKRGYDALVILEDAKTGEKEKLHPTIKPARDFATANILAQNWLRENGYVV